MSKRYKVIFWGPGNIGGTALRMALERPEFEVVGAKVWSPDKDGVDANIQPANSFSSAWPGLWSMMVR